MTFGLTPLGVLHTIVSLVAIAAGIAALVRYREISPRSRAGRVYVASTVVVCLTGFGIFQHGGFGPPHALGIITLATLGVAYAAGRGRFGRFSRRLEIVTYSLTFFFHSIPGVTESLTRLPYGHPLVKTQEDPVFPMIYGAFFVIFLVLVVLQVRWLGAHEATGARDWEDEGQRPA